MSLTRSKLRINAKEPRSLYLKQMEVFHRKKVWHDKEVGININEGQSHKREYKLQKCEEDLQRCEEAIKKQEEKLKMKEEELEKCKKKKESNMFFRST